MTLPLFFFLGDLGIHAPQTKRAFRKKNMCFNSRGPVGGQP